MVKWLQHNSEVYSKPRYLSTKKLGIVYRVIEQKCLIHQRPEHLVWTRTVKNIDVFTDDIDRVKKCTVSRENLSIYRETFFVTAGSVADGFRSARDLE